MLAKFLFTRPRLEKALSALDKGRLTLPVVSLKKLFPDFDQQLVKFGPVPVGPWSSPVADVTMLMKVVACSRPKTVMEVGSYRGYTALMLAEHMQPGGRLVTVDMDERHGEAYRDSPLSAMIERRVTQVSEQAFASEPRKTYDLIFLDADHSYDAVKRDTEILLPLLSDTGYFVWHDYANWGKFDGTNGVPEYLHELSEKIPVASVAGSWLGIHSPAWATPSGSAAFRDALLARSSPTDTDPWSSEGARG